MSSAEVPTPVSRDVRLVGGGIELQPLDVDHAAALDEAVRESAAELTGTVPWWRPDATVADQEEWARFTVDAWTQGTLYAFVVLGVDDDLALVFDHITALVDAGATLADLHDAASWATASLSPRRDSAEPRQRARWAGASSRYGSVGSAQSGGSTVA